MSDVFVSFRTEVKLLLQFSLHTYLITFLLSLGGEVTYSGGTHFPWVWSSETLLRLNGSGMRTRTPTTSDRSYKLIRKRKGQKKLKF